MTSYLPSRPIRATVAAAAAVVVAVLMLPASAAAPTYQRVPAGASASPTFTEPIEPVISADGKYVAFAAMPSGGSLLPAVYVYDRLHNKVQLVSKNADQPSISGNGRYV